MHDDKHCRDMLGRCCTRKRKEGQESEKREEGDGDGHGHGNTIGPGSLRERFSTVGASVPTCFNRKKTAFQWPKSEKNTSRILKGGVMWCVFSAKEKVEKKSGKPSPSHVPAPRGMDRSTSLAEKGNKVTCHCDNQTGRTDDYLDFIPAVTSYFSMKSLFKHCIICIHQGMVPGHLP